MKIPYYQVNAFTSTRFGGNPAGICILPEWLPDELMQHIALENNLAETAFIVSRGDQFALRWFTPEVEVDLCGHATLAAAFVYFELLEYRGRAISFETRSGILRVERSDGHLVLDFPSRAASRCSVPEELIKGLGRMPKAVLKARDYLALFENEDEVRTLEPDFGALKKLDCFGIIATAKGENSDFVSRFFAPAAGILEDPATGSAHCTLVPFWSQRIGKRELYAIQLSKRGGELHCLDCGDRVKIGGQSVLYLRGEIDLG